MPASQPIDIPDAKKRNKKKKRCRATDSFSGRFEGECERVYQGLKVCVRARVCASFMVMLPLFTQSWYRSHPAFVIVVIQTLPILLIRLPLSTPICFSTKTARRFRVCSLQLLTTFFCCSFCRPEYFTVLSISLLYIVLRICCSEYRLFTSLGIYGKFCPDLTPSRVYTVRVPVYRAPCRCTVSRKWNRISVLPSRGMI